MKIVGVETYLVASGNRNMPLVRVLTDEGIARLADVFEKAGMLEG